MRKYLKINLGSGICEELVLEDFQKCILDYKFVEETEQFLSYVCEEYIAIEDKIADYDE